MFPLIMLAVGLVLLVLAAAFKIGQWLSSAGLRYRRVEVLRLNVRTTLVADVDAFQEVLERHRREIIRAFDMKPLMVGITKAEEAARDRDLCRNCQQPLAIPFPPCPYHETVAAAIAASKVRP